MTKFSCLSCNILESGKFSWAGKNLRQRVHHLLQNNVCVLCVFPVNLVSNSECHHGQASTILEKWSSEGKESFYFVGRSWDHVYTVQSGIWVKNYELLTKLCLCLYKCLYKCVPCAYICVCMHRSWCVSFCTWNRLLRLWRSQWAFNQAWLKQELALIVRPYAQSLGSMKKFDQF